MPPCGRRGWSRHRGGAGRRSGPAPGAGGPGHERVPPHRRVRLPVRLREQLPDRPGRLRRVALPAPPRLPQRVRRPPRPLGRLLPVRPGQHPGPPPAALRPRHHGHRDDVAHPVRLADHPRTFLVIRKVDGEDPPSRGTAGRPRDSAASGVLLRTARCISGKVEIDTSLACPLFDYGASTGQWSYDGDGYGSATVRDPGGHHSLAVVSSLRLGVVGAVLRAHHAGGGGGGLHRPVVGRRPADQPGGRRRRPRLHGGLLA